MKIARVLVLVGLVWALAPSEGQAIHFGNPVHYCLVSSGLTSCASATFSIDGGQLVVELENIATGDNAYALTAFGFYFHPASGEDNGGDLLFTGFSDPAGNWQGPPDNAFTNPFDNGDVRFVGLAFSHDSDDWLYGPGQIVEFRFDIAGEWSSQDWANLDFGFRGQAWAGEGGSFKCYSQTDGESTPSGAECTTTVTPEPVTMVLLGSGLMGLAGVGARRRKQQIDEA